MTDKQKAVNQIRFTAFFNYIYEYLLFIRVHIHSNSDKFL